MSSNTLRTAWPNAAACAWPLAQPDPLRGGGGAPWTPLDLFRAGDSGFLVQKAPISQFYTDTAGTTPVATDGDRIARIEELVAGTATTQAVLTKRLTYHPGGISSDGFDDYHEMAFSPSDTMTLFWAGTVTNSNVVLLGSANAVAATSRCMLLVDSSTGRLRGFAGTDSLLNIGGADIRGSFGLNVMRFSPAAAELWRNTTLEDSVGRSGSLMSTSLPLYYGALNNVGTASNFAATTQGELACAINRWVSDEEIALASAWAHSQI